MVLHDNKWDKKAKQAYNRKHGIVAPKPTQKILPKDHWKYDSETPEVGPIEDDSGDNSNELATLSFEELPEMLEQDAEERAIIAKSIAAAQGEKKAYRSHVTVTSDAAEFDRISSNVEHTRLARDMRRRFGNAKAGNLEEDDDFEAFMDRPIDVTPPPSNAITGKVQVDEEKQKFIDSLLR